MSREARSPGTVSGAFQFPFQGLSTLQPSATNGGSLGVVQVTVPP